MLSKSLSQDDKKEIARLVVAELQGTPVPTTNGPVITERSDDRTDAFDETEAKLIKQLANPNIVIYKGRRGGWKVNETQEALNALLDYRKERKAWKTGSKL